MKRVEDRSECGVCEHLITDKKQKTLKTSIPAVFYVYKATNMSEVTRGFLWSLSHQCSQKYKNKYQ